MTSGKYDPLIEAYGGDTNTENTDISCECPKCDKKKLYINRDSSLFLCFCCEYSGRAVDLVAELHGITPRTAKEFLHKYTNGGVSLSGNGLRDTMRKLTERPLSPAKAAKVQVKLPQGAVPLSGTPGEKYLLKRGFNKRLVKGYRLLYVPPSKSGAVFNPAANHVIFPCYARNGILEFWSSRAAYDPVVYGPKSTGPGGVSKKAVVYGLHEFQPYRGDGRLILVEGPLDALSLDRNGCALLGKYLSDLQIQRLLVTGRNSGIIVCLDSGELRASWDAAARIARWSDQVEVYVGSTDPYKDANEVLAAGKDPVKLIRDSAVRFTECAYRKARVTAR